jgi:hypothetical protein
MKYSTVAALAMVLYDYGRLMISICIGVLTDTILEALTFDAEACLALMDIVATLTCFAVG